MTLEALVAHLKRAISQELKAAGYDGHIGIDTYREDGVIRLYLDFSSISSCLDEVVVTLPELCNDNTAALENGIEDLLTVIDIEAYQNPDPWGIRLEPEEFDLMCRILEKIA